MNQIQANIRVLSDDEIVRIHNTSVRSARWALPGNRSKSPCDLPQPVCRLT